MAAPALCVAMLASCSEDFLKPEPLSFFAPESTFTSKTGLQAAMSYADRHMHRNFYSDNTNTIPICTDMMFTEHTVYGKTDVGSGFFDNVAMNLTPTSWMATGFNDGIMIGYMWNDMWDHVKAGNTVLNFVDDVEDLDEDVRDEFKGRAYWHRAWAYYNLCFWFGDLPLVTALPASPKQDYYSTPIQEIMKMLCKDLEFAVEHVPFQKDMSIYGTVNKEACMHLLVKTYLAAGEFKKAEDMATELIEKTDRKLMTQSFGTQHTTMVPTTHDIKKNVIWDLHRSENKLLGANKEYIMGSPSVSAEAFQSLPAMRVLGPCVIGQDRTITPDNKGKAQERDFMALNNAKYDNTKDWLHVMGRGIGIFRPTYWAQHGLWNDPATGKEDLQDLRHNPEVGNWVRMEDQTYFQPNSSFNGEKMTLFVQEDIKNKSGKVLVKKGTLLCSDTIRQWFDVPLYKIWFHDLKAWETNGSNDYQGASMNEQGGQANVYIFRLAETYLLRAEARLYQGNQEGAAADLNAIRARANAEWMYPNNVTIDDIMDERARELYFEEFRKAELTRVSMLLAQTGIADRWGNVYSKDTWNKQEGTELTGGSYWYQRLMHYSFYNHGTINSCGMDINYRMDKKNLFWPVPKGAFDGNINGELHQNYGYDGYNENVKMWATWQEADEAARQN